MKAESIKCVYKGRKTKISYLRLYTYTLKLW